MNFFLIRFSSAESVSSPEDRKPADPSASSDELLEPDEDEGDGAVCFLGFDDLRSGRVLLFLPARSNSFSDDVCSADSDVSACVVLLERVAFDACRPGCAILSVVGRNSFLCTAVCAELLLHLKATA